MQSTARKNELPLDQMCLVCEVTKKNKEEVTMPPKEGAFVHGLYMEVAQTINFMPSLKPTVQGARWDIEINSISDSRLKELHPEMPVIHLKAITEVSNKYKEELFTSN